MLTTASAVHSSPGKLGFISIPAWPSSARHTSALTASMIRFDSKMTLRSAPSTWWISSIATSDSYRVTSSARSRARSKIASRIRIRSRARFFPDCLLSDSCLARPRIGRFVVVSCDFHRGPLKLAQRRDHSAHQRSLADVFCASADDQNRQTLIPTPYFLIRNPY